MLTTSFTPVSSIFRTALLASAVTMLAAGALAQPASGGTFEFRKYVPQLKTTAITPGVLTASTSMLNFGAVATNTTKTSQVLVTLSEGGAVSFSGAPAVSGDAAYSAGVTSCGVALSRGASCLAEAVFSPTDVGAYSGLLTIAAESPAVALQVPLAGSAFNPVSLASSTLPEGTVGQPYSYDFKQLLQVSNEVDPQKTEATWSGAGSLPAGLTLNASAGLLSGTPTQATAGQNYTVTGTYKVNQGQQTYTLVINGVVLEVVDVSSGGFHTCALMSNGGVKCWGLGTSGQLGNGGVVTSLVPVDVVGLPEGASSVSAGGSHTCVVTKTGAAKCWGAGSYGQLGNGSGSAVSQPVAVTGLAAGVAQIDAGSSHTCALTTGGGVKCWGAGGQGQLGRGSLAGSLVPVDVTGMTSGGASVSAGGDFSCAVSQAGGAFCWGYGGTGRLGNGIQANSTVPSEVSGLASGVAAVSAGTSFACALTSAGGVKCWGEGGSGQLGNGATSSSAVPVTVISLSSAAHISAGGAHGCALLTSGGAKCWGAGGSGRKGDGTTTNSGTPTDVAGLTSGVSAVSAGEFFGCAGLASGGAKCWGSAGRLGNNTSTASSVPVDVLF